MTFNMTYESNRMAYNLDEKRNGKYASEWVNFKLETKKKAGNGLVHWPKY